MSTTVDHRFDALFTHSILHTSIFPKFLTRLHRSGKSANGNGILPILWLKPDPRLKVLYIACRIDVHARLLILRKKSPLHDLIWVCTFIDFGKKFPPARLFHPARIKLLDRYCTFIDFPENFPPACLFGPARLIFFKNFPSCTFISSYTSIRHTRVGTYFLLRIVLIYSLDFSLEG